METVRRPVVIGGACVDVKGKPYHPLCARTSHAGLMERTPGGVAFNVAANLAQLGVEPSLISLVGQDADGAWLLGECARLGIPTELIAALPGCDTAAYLAILDERGDLYSAIAAMDIYDGLTPAFLERHERVLTDAALVVADTNAPCETIAYLAGLCKSQRIPLWIEPTTADKCRKCLLRPDGITWLSPNREELEALCEAALPGEDDLVKGARSLVARGVGHVFVTLGEEGVLWVTAEQALHRRARPVPVKDVTGAGDAFVAGVVWSILRGRPLEEAIDRGVAAALITIQGYESVSPDLSARTLEEAVGAQ